MCDAARTAGFEFKVEKGQFNQPQIEFWGCVLDGTGRHVQEKKVEQLVNWPEPDDPAAVNSFLSFVNYLREYMDPEWVKYEQVLRPLRKKNADFTMWKQDKKYREAFEKIRTCLLYTSPSPRDGLLSRMPSSA